MKEKNINTQLLPKYRFKSILDVKPEDLKKMGAKGVGLDIDNTIAPDGTYNFIPGIKDWINKIQSAGYPIIIISNGSLLRVWPISKYLGNISFIHLSSKPKPRSLIKAAKRMNIDITELAMLGDQLFSDILAANRCGAISVRIDPLTSGSLYPHYYKWKAKREAPILKEYERTKGYGTD